jgi:opacity protein-like surface antigen
MKKILLTAVAVFAFSLANAQDTKFGAKAGLDMVTATSSGMSYSATGFFLGGSAEFGIADKIALQPGLNYHTATSDGAKFNYLSVPVLLKYSAADKINLIAGPALFYNMEDVKDKSSFNLQLGGSYDITENLSIEPSYSLGLTGDVKVNHLFIGLGYKF